MSSKILPASLEQAALIHQLTREAFAAYDQLLVVPANAAGETLEAVQKDLTEGQGVVAWQGEVAVGTARYQVKADHLYVGRVAVLPAYQKQGIGEAIMRHMEEIALELNLHEIRLSTREALPANIRFYQRLGYIITGTEPHPRGPDTIVYLAKQITTLEK